MPTSAQNSTMVSAVQTKTTSAQRMHRSTLVKKTLPKSTTNKRSLTAHLSIHPAESGSQGSSHPPAKRRLEVLTRGVRARTAVRLSAPRMAADIFLSCQKHAQFLTKNVYITTCQQSPTSSLASKQPRSVRQCRSFPYFL